MRHVDGGCPNESTAMGPIANQEVRGARTVWPPRSRERRGRELAPIQTPPRYVYYNPDFRFLSSEAMWDAALITHYSYRCDPRSSTMHPLADQAQGGAWEMPPLRPEFRLIGGDQWPVTMIDDFPPPAAGGVAVPGVQIGAPLPPAADSGVQISPRVAATPSCPLAVVTRGPY
jgi:hypothetical protein